MSTLCCHCRGLLVLIGTFPNAGAMCRGLPSPGISGGGSRRALDCDGTKFSSYFHFLAIMT